MANFNLGKRKNFVEDNMRYIIQILTGLMASQSAIESQCLLPYDETKTYAKGQICLYNNYLYLCNTTCTGPFDESKWSKQTDSFDELDLDTIKTLLGLTPEEIQKMSDLISDSEVRLDKTYSSSKIYMSIQAAIDTSKTYTLSEIGKMSGASYKVVTSTTEMTDERIIYLLASGSTYDMYIVEVDGTPTKIGDTTIDLSDYLTKTDAENTYLKKTDATATYATIETVNGKMDNKFISTIIGNDNVETNDQLVSAKAVAELKRRIFSRPLGESILEYADSLDTSRDSICVTVRVMDAEDAPYGTTGTVTNDCYYTISKIYNTNDYCVIKAKDIRTNDEYLRMKTAGIWYDWVKVLNQANVITMCELSNGGHTAISSWIDSLTGSMIMSFDLVDADDKVYRIQFDYLTGVFYSFRFDGTDWVPQHHYCVTKVNDVPKTIITDTLESTKVTFKNPDSYVSYYVKNGTCYVTIWSMTILETCNVEVLFRNVPKSVIGATCPLCNGKETFAQVFISPNSTKIEINASTELIGKNGYCTLSYPVADS